MKFSLWYEASPPWISTPEGREGEPREIKYLNPLKKEVATVSPDLTSMGTRFFPVSRMRSTS